MRVGVTDEVLKHFFALDSATVRVDGRAYNKKTGLAVLTGYYLWLRLAIRVNVG